MLTVKTNFGQHRISIPSSSNYLHTQFPEDIKIILTKLDSIEGLLLQLVETTSSYDLQPQTKDQKYEGVPSSTINSVIQGTVSEIRDSLTGATGFLLDEATSNSSTSLVQIIKASDVDVATFLEYRQYLQDPVASQNFSLPKHGTLISTSEELQAFDDYLQENEDKMQLFKIFLQTKMYKCNDMEKLIRSLIADDIFLEYNYAGALGKQSLGQMVLFENLLFNVCYNGENQEEYINELKKIIHRAKNRIYKNRSISKAKEQLELEYKATTSTDADESAIEVEVGNINSIFINALSNDLSASSSSSPLFPISDAVKLEAFDRLLKSDPTKLDQFKQFVRLLMVKYEDPDKVLLDIIAADVYLKYNYSGTAQKKALKDMILFEQVFHEVCFRQLSFEEYVGELKKIILRNKNRAYKNVRTPDVNQRGREAIIVEVEDELLDNFEYWLELDLNQPDLANSRVFPINSPARLEALDEVLRSNQLLKQLMQHHVERYVDRFKILDKVLPRFVDDEVFMEYNYAGVWGKNTLKDMILFERIFYETCYRAQPFQIYVKELIRIVQVAKNRVHRKNANNKKKVPIANEGILEDVLAEDAMEEFEEELNRLQEKEHLLLDSKLFPIDSSTNLRAFDKCLQADPERRTLFAQFLRKISPSLDKVMEKLIKDDLFTQYNYQGIKGKKAFSSLVLFDQVLFEAYGVPENLSFQKYVRKIKKICRRASNRLNKKRFTLQRRKIIQSSNIMPGHIGANGEVIFETVDIENEEEVIETDDDEDMSNNDDD